jgi:hypothetical protein
MSTTTQHKRGTTAAHAGYTGPQGEFTYNTDEKRIHAHDGSTAGGIKVAKLSEVEAVQQSLDNAVAAAVTIEDVHAASLYF